MITIKRTLAIGLFLTLGIAVAAQSGKAKINWLSWEEATALENTEGKKYFVDLYTDWCGYCKKMDRTTFKDPKVVAFVNANFIPIKLNAEQKEDIQYRGHTMKLNKKVGRRGMHELAMALLEGLDRVGYPTYVYLDAKQDRITLSPGFKPANDMLLELKFVGDDHYQTTSFQEFAKNNP
ncbi:MAG: DUF255 domain-containing protein [Bacteroidota bacterium]